MSCFFVLNSADCLSAGILFIFVGLEEKEVLSGSLLLGWGGATGSGIGSARGSSGCLGGGGGFSTNGCCPGRRIAPTGCAEGVDGGVTEGVDNTKGGGDGGGVDSTTGDGGKRCCSIRSRAI